jgi:glycosyltransferase involved in cell wall biosynthesis
LGLSESGIVIGYVGQIDGRKDPVATLRFAEFLETALEQPIQLVFAGREEPDISLDLDRAVGTSPMKDRVRRMGRVQDIVPVLSALDLYVLSSRNEGFFPLALIEALERGVPVVAPTVGGISTMLKEGKGGFLIQRPDDRRPVKNEALQNTAAKVAAEMKKPGAWDALRQEAYEFGTALTLGYDADSKVRQALSTWIP